MVRDRLLFWPSPGFIDALARPPRAWKASAWAGSDPSIRRRSIAISARPDISSSSAHSLSGPSRCGPGGRPSLSMGLAQAADRASPTSSLDRASLSSGISRLRTFCFAVRSFGKTASHFSGPDPDSGQLAAWRRVRSTAWPNELPPRPVAQRASSSKRGWRRRHRPSPLRPAHTIGGPAPVGSGLQWGSFSEIWL